MQPFADRSEAVLNSSIIEQILEMPIVVEQSPPELDTLASILKSGVKGSGTMPFPCIWPSMVTCIYSSPSRWRS